MLTGKFSVLLVLAVAAVPRLALAQAKPPAAPPQAPVVREQVEVVATKMPEVPHDVAASIEVITGDQLRAMGAMSLGDALSLAAGVAVAPGGDNGPAGSVPEFWGLREFDAFLLVVDDVPLGGAFNPALTSLSLRDVERVEVMRGAAPVTYGATSFVGVIHVVHKAGTEKASYASVSGGSYKTGSGAIDFAVPTGGGWQSRGSISFDRQGFTDDRTDFRRGQGLFRTVKTNGNNKMYFTADGTVLNQSPASPHVREGGGLSATTPLDANYNPADARLNDTTFGGAFGIERQVMTNRTWSFTASYRHTGTDIFRGFLMDLSNSANNAAGFTETIDVNDIYADTHMVIPASAQTRIVAGADYLFGNGEAKGATFHYTVPLSGATATSVTEPTTLDKDAEARRQFFGAYVLAEFTPNSRVKLSAGGRVNGTTERRGESGTVTNTKFSGSLGGLFTLWEQGPDHIKLFANYRDTFKPAAFDFSLVENEGILKPETARSFEGGVKMFDVDARVEFEASVFRMDFKNLVTATVVNGLPSMQNAGTTRFQGAEFAVDVRGSHNVSARASYSFHDGKFVDFTQQFDGVNTQLGGNRFEMSARHLFSAGLLVSPQQGFVASAVLKYTGDRYLNMRNTALADPFATIDAGAGYRKDRIEIRIDGRNLTNRRDAVSESELGDAQYYRMTARRVDLTLGIRF